MYNAITKRSRQREEDMVDIRPPKRLDIGKLDGGPSSSGTKSGTGKTTSATTTSSTTTTSTSTTTSGTGTSSGTSSSSSKSSRGRGKGCSVSASGEAGTIGGENSEIGQGRGSASGEAGPVCVQTPKKGRGRGLGRSRLLNNLSVTATFEQRSRASSQEANEDREASTTSVNNRIVTDS